MALSKKGCPCTISSSFAHNNSPSSSTSLLVSTVYITVHNPAMRATMLNRGTGSVCTRDILSLSRNCIKVKLVHSSAARPMRLLHTPLSMFTNSQTNPSGRYRTDVNLRLFTCVPGDIFNTNSRYAQIGCNRCSNPRNSRSFWRKAFKAPKPPPPRPKLNYKFDFDHTLKSLQGIHQYVKENLSLDLWTVNLLLVGFVAGPSIYTAMKNSSHTEDDYMFSIPVDDPGELELVLCTLATASCHIRLI